jgi:hypothetical protein
MMIENLGIKPDDHIKNSTQELIAMFSATNLMQAIRDDGKRP